MTLIGFGALFLAGCGGGGGGEGGGNSAVSSSGTGGSSGGGAKTIVVDGSSTVFRISKAAQVGYGKVNPDIEVVVESHGTGGGFGRYMEGEVDIVDASREAKPEETAKATGKLAWTRYLVGHDGISVLVNPKNDFVSELGLADLKKLWEPDSKIKTWKDLNPAWPDRKITFFSPDKDSGTFEYFTEAVNKKARAQRSDIQASPDDNTLVRGVAGDADSIGYFGFAYYSANASKLKLVKIKGDKGAVAPSKETILSGEYPALARPLYLYVKNDSLKRAEVKAFLGYYLENVVTLSEKAGYVGPTAEEIKANSGVFAGAGAAPEAQQKSAQ
ncbi:MAG: PstS family phosphate ABC transporter substrate-binding protein [Planctomycetota bacterium]